MTGIAHFFDASRLMSATGDATSASVAFYYSGTNNPAPVYTDEALTTPASNPLSIAFGAIVPELYLQPGVSYRRIITFPDATVQDLDPLPTTSTLSGITGAAQVGADDGASGVNYTTVQGGLDFLEDAVEAVATNLSIVASNEGSDLYEGVPPLDVVASRSTANKADPSISDTEWVGNDIAPTIGTTLANQLRRVRGQTTGVLSAVGTTTLGSLAVTRKYPVTAGQTYTASLHNAPLPWTLYPNGFMQFYNTDGSFHSSISSGFTLSADGRSLTFTVPAGATKWASNLQYTAASDSNPITLAQLTVAHNNLMLNVGATAADFSPYVTDEFSPTSASFDSSALKPIRLTRQGEFTYVRTPAQQSLLYDLIWRMHYGHGLNYNAVEGRSGVIDFYGQRFVPASAKSTVSAFNQSTLVHTNGGDESCPERRNSMFVDGNHGSTCYRVTKAAHGMTAVDVWSIWSDGVSQWVLLYIESTSVLVFQRRYTGTNTKWAISSDAPSSSTFTHVSGATHTGNIAFTSPSAWQFVPIIIDQVQRIMVDGVEVTTDGDYSGSSVWMEEVYSGLNIAKVQDLGITAVGSPTPTWTPDVAQSRVYNRYEWNKWGACSIYTSRHVVDPYTRTSLIDYWGGIQYQRLSLAVDSTPGMHDAVELYIPDVGTVSGLNFRAKADITSNVTNVDILASDCDDPSKPSTMFCLLGKTGGAYSSGQVCGYDPLTDLGEYVTRETKVNSVFNLSSGNKCYPKLIDSEAGDAVAGEEFEAVCYRAPFVPTDADLTIPAVVVSVRKETRFLVAAHQTLTNKSISVPKEFSGAKIEIINSDDFTLLSPFIEDGVIRAAFTNAHGWAILDIGKS